MGKWKNRSRNRIRWLNFTVQLKSQLFLCLFQFLVYWNLISKIFLLCWWENFEFDTFLSEKFLTFDFKLGKEIFSLRNFADGQKVFFWFYGKVVCPWKAQILKITIFEFSPKNFIKRNKIYKNIESLRIYFQSKTKFFLHNVKFTLTISIGLNVTWHVHCLL